MRGKLVYSKKGSYGYDPNCDCDRCIYERRLTSSRFRSDAFEVRKKNKVLFNIESIAIDIAKLIEDKCHAYGDSIASIEVMLKELYPNGIVVDQFPTAFLLIRILDKIKRLAVGKSDNFENWQDIAGYALRALEKVKK